METKKASSKLIVTVLSCAALFSLLIILATCSLFDSEELPATTVTTDWKTIIKGSKWTFSSSSISDKSNLVPALKTVKTVSFSDDYSMTIEYTDNGGNSYYLSAGTFSFVSSSTGSISVRQASSSGYLTNNLSIGFSNQTEKQFDSKNYIMTITVSGLGSLYFFID